MPHVQQVKIAKLAGCLALLSFHVVTTHVAGQIALDSRVATLDVVPPEAAAANARPDVAADDKQFRLVLTYHDDADKPFYNLILSVPPTAEQQDPFKLFTPISEAQAAKIIKELSATEFFTHARVTKTQDDPKTGPQYLLRVTVGDRHYEETLGWHVGTIVRLDRLRRALDGDAAKLMDRLLDRLAGQRKLWESGETLNDLKTTLSANQATFAAGRPISIKLELSNTGNLDRQFGQHHFIRSGTEIVVIDEYGRRVPYLAGGAGLKQSQVTIKPAETKVLESCDLTSFYYLRRPGRYWVYFHAAGLPQSNALPFEVVADDAALADGDPMGRLLPLVAGKWAPQGSPNPAAKIRPGRNRAETSGWQFVFPLTDRGVKGSKAVVWLWLASEPAEELAAPRDDFLQTSEDLGMISRWHVYLSAPREALDLWPTVKEDLKAALEKDPHR